MERDFDAERVAAAPERVIDFKIGGKTFHIRPFVPPEMLLYFDDWTAESSQKTIEGFDKFILDCIEPSEAKAWRDVRKKADPAINMNDLEDVAFWILGRITGRPTKPLSQSQRGSGERATISKAA